MNQSELIEKVAQATELNQAAVGQAVKAVVNAISMPSSPGMRSVSPDLASSMWRRGLHAKGGIHGPERRFRSPLARLCDSTQARPSKMPSIHRHRRGLPGRRLHHQGNPRCGSKFPLDALWQIFLGHSAFAHACQKNRFESRIVDGGVHRDMGTSSCGISRQATRQCANRAHRVSGTGSSNPFPSSGTGAVPSRTLAGERPPRRTSTVFRRRRNRMPPSAHSAA